MDIIDNLKKDGMLLKKVPKKEQTVEYCKLAIKQNPLALRYASIRCINSKICFSAVKKMYGHLDLFQKICYKSNVSGGC